jgi:uncharacterized protein involved in exopolysaccharide biosynthesis
VPELFDLQDYVDHLRKRWTIAAIAVVVAALLAGGITLLLPKRYRATAKIVIEPPAGSDMRAAMSVSPIYLESLKTYEHFATSDKVFSQAVDHFELRKKVPGRSLESWKSRVLRVNIPRNTKILEISATLEDPKQAHALALYLAEETIKLNRNISREGDRELTDDALAQLEPAKRARDEAEAEWSRLMTAEPVETIKGEIEALELRQFRAERELLEADTRIAEYAGRDKAAGSAAEDNRARAAFLRERVKTLEQELGAKRALLARRTARREELETQRKSAQAAYEATLTRVRDIRSAVGYRGERLNLVDPGVVPENPSSPRMVLNVGAAVLVALLASLFFLSFEFAYGSRRRSAPPVTLRHAGTAYD